ncbi:hypothetical protein niasHS_016600 [Heterodera schachtii]|uniref:Uncharacterized protein n=1 Tax=Heterodera schachtii TaxID=97005 RepID=A0ABD2HRL3_HETSC
MWGRKGARPKTLDIVRRAEALGTATGRRTSACQQTAAEVEDNHKMMAGQNWIIPLLPLLLVVGGRPLAISCQAAGIGSLTSAPVQQAGLFSPGGRRGTTNSCRTKNGGTGGGTKMGK